MTKPELTQAVQAIFEALEAALQLIQAARKIPKQDTGSSCNKPLALLVAYSGGMDSQVLLHALSLLQRRYKNGPHTQVLTKKNTSNTGITQRMWVSLRVIHIDHGLQAGSAQWLRHCQQFCHSLSLPFQGIRLNMQLTPGESIEAQARQQRYQVFREHLKEDEYLVTAHHQDDQAETVFLNLLRGSGGMGLAAMPQCRVFHQGYLLRPLLTVPRQVLANYAQYYQLHWQEDPSNQQQRFDRNYLRHDILPAIEQRWPAWRKTVARATHWQGEQQHILTALLDEKLPTLEGYAPNTLNVTVLSAYDMPMQKALLRRWLSQLGFSAPSSQKMRHILSDVLPAAHDAVPCVHWPGCEVRRYQNALYALKPLAGKCPSRRQIWEDIRQPLYIPYLERSLSPSLLAEWADYLATQSLPVSVCFRQGGERIRQKKRPSRRLKNFLQEQGVPPWERGRIPLLYIGHTLIQVVGLLNLSPEQVELG